MSSFTISGPAPAIADAVLASTLPATPRVNMRSSSRASQRTNST
jgi:hypothetical protein